MPHQFMVEIEQSIVAYALAVWTVRLHYVGNCFGSGNALILPSLLAPDV